MTGTELGAALAAFLLALGIAVSPLAYLGGMMLALWCTYFIRAWRATDKRKGIVLSLLGGATVAHAAASLHPHMAGLWAWGEMPLQVQMMLSGAFSQAVVELFVARGDRFVARMADRVGLKGETE